MPVPGTNQKSVEDIYIIDKKEEAVNEAKSKIAEKANGLQVLCASH